MSETELPTLGSTAAELIIGALIVGLLCAVVLRATYDLGLRAFAQRQWVVQWLAAVQQDKRDPAGRSYDRYALTGAVSEMNGIGTAGSIYALDYRQLCAQIATSMQAGSEIPWDSLSPLGRVFLEPIPFSSRYADSFTSTIRERPDAEAYRDYRLRWLERRVDDLQSYLRRAWLRFHYAASLVTSFVAVVVIALAISGITQYGAAFALLLLLPVLYSLLAILELIVNASRYVSQAVNGYVRIFIPIVAFILLLVVTSSLAPVLRAALIQAVAVGYAGGLLAPMMLSLLSKIDVVD